MSTDVENLAMRYGTAWAARDLDAIMALHTGDTVFHLHGDAAPAEGSAATRAAFAAALDQWPDLRFERKRVHIGAGREIACDGVDVFSVRDGLVARKDTYLDWAAVQRQTAEPATAPA